MSSHVGRAPTLWLRTPPASKSMLLARLGLAVGLLFCAWVWPAPVRAQQAVTLASLQIGIWPEYDRPTALVILNGQLAPGVALPVSVNVRLPAAAKAPNAVAVTAADGNLITAPFTIAAAPTGDIIVTFMATAAAFRVEYYDPRLVVEGEARSFAFRWQSDYTIGDVSLHVQEPFGAHDLKGQPALTAAGAGSDGLNYYTASLGALARGSIVALDLTYAKPSSALSATAVGTAVSAGTPVSPPAPLNSSGLGTALGANWPWVVGSVALGFLLVGGGVFWFRRQNQPAPASRASRRPRRAPPLPAPSLVSRLAQPDPGAVVPIAAPAISKVDKATTINEAPASFCTQCGQRHQSGDRFCRQCGAPVRQ